MELRKWDKAVSIADTQHAASLLDEVIGHRGIREPVKCMLERAYGQLAKVNTKWTRRRVRAVWEMKAARIDHREIVEMETVIEARKRHAAHKQETARLVAAALARASDQDRGMAPGSVGQLGGMGSPGTAADGAGQRADGG